MTWKVVNISDTGTASKFGADDTDKINKLFSGNDVDDIDINADFKFRDQKLQVANPANTFKYIFVGSAIGANRNITIPLLTATDTLAVLGLSQTFTEKLIIKKDIVPVLNVYRDSNTVSNETQVALSAKSSTNVERKYGRIEGIINDNTNGAEEGALAGGYISAGSDKAAFWFDSTGAYFGENQYIHFSDTGVSAERLYTFPNIDGQLHSSGDVDHSFTYNRLRIWNPANTFRYTIIAAAIAADRNWTLPLLAASDTAVGEAHAQALTNKTVNTTDNTVTATSQAAGDLLKNNGTKFVRMGVGTANQVLTTNSSATDLAWLSIPRILDKSTTNNSINTSNSETSLYSISLPANTVVSHGVVEVELQGTYLNNTAGTSTLTLVIKYGTTTMYNDITNALGQAATKRQWNMRVLLSPDNNSSSAQILSGQWAISDVGGTTTGLGNSDDDEIQVWTPLGGTSAENAASGSLTFDIRFQHQTSDANIDITRKLVITRYLP